MDKNFDIKEFLKPNEEFQSSINIAYDLGDRKKVKGLIPTSTVCRYVEEILKDVIYKSTQRSKLLVGAYGKGKSHITLAALSAMYDKDESLYENLIDAYEREGSSFSEALSGFVSDGPRLLPVVITGSSTDIARSLLYALRSSLQDIGMEVLMPQTNYGGALDTVRRWKSDFPDTYSRLEELVEMNGAAIESALLNYDTGVYERFLSAYPMLTSGSTFDTLADANVIETYEQVLTQLKNEGYSGIYVVYDEFSKFLESSIASATLEDTKLLQDFAEACNRSSQDAQLHLLLISHKNLSNYIDANLPKEKVDGWRGVSGRFVEIEIYDNSDQSYELMSNAINKDHSLWGKFVENNERFLLDIKSRYIEKGLLNTDNAESVVFGCYPMHPLTAFLLPRVSEIVAQNERTLFTFLSAKESKSLPQRADSGDIKGWFITPDYIYDYFEPLLRKEQFGSRAHDLYILAKSSLSKVPEGSIESRIVKTLVMVYLVSQFNQLPPTRDAISLAFADSGFELEEIDEAINNLVDAESLVYLRRSDSYIKLKESSGIRIDESIDNEAELLKTKLSVAEILNNYQNGRAIYPSRHNIEKMTTRYFDCRFESESEIVSKLENGENFEFTGDGAIVAVLPDSKDSLPRIQEFIKSSNNVPLTVVFAIPKTYVDISDAAYKFEAAARLKDAAKNDEVLRDEYDIVMDDYEEVLSRFVADYFWPERNGASYFIEGHRKNGVTHRKRLSTLLSDLCDKVYSKTPVINNEVINKNEPTGIALNSRAKILTALCSKNLEPNLGFVGSGQETSIARSVLSVTGVIENIESEPALNLDPKESKVGYAIAEIEGFLKNSEGESFANLYDRLTLPEYHIGAKRGPIPILIAVVLRQYRDMVCIMRGDEECAIEKKTLEDIESSPEEFTVSFVDWDEEKSAYVSEIASIFGGHSEVLSKTQVVELAKSWYVSLPQFTRLSKVNHAATVESCFSIEHEAFFKAMRQPSINANEFLFDTLPNAFGCDIAGVKLTQDLRREISACNRYIEDVVETIAYELQRLIDPTASRREQVSSTVATWIESLSDKAKRHVFSGAGNRIMSTLINFTPSTQTSIMRLAKAAVSLRIEDWDDDLYDRFFDVLRDFFDEVGKFENGDADLVATSQAITFYADDGTEIVRSFKTVECSPRADLLKNQIMSSIDEMGQSVSRDEMRQVVFEVLREMC